jgi:Domain of unknown function (DUF4287)
MSFQGYLDAIMTKTGKTPADFRAYAEKKGWTAGGTLVPGIKPTAIITDLKATFGLGHGHATAIMALLKGLKKEGDP